MLNCDFLAQSLDLRNPQNTDYFTSKPLLVKLALLLTNALVLTPLAVAFWAGVWDILHELIYPDDTPLSLLVTWGIGNGLLLSAYLLQDLLQSIHSRLEACSGIAYIYRCIYFYVLSVAYVCHYRAYWDAYSYFTSSIDYRFFFGISILATLIYRYILRGDWLFFNAGIPFVILPKGKSNQHFLLNRFHLTGHGLLDKFLDFVYFEFVQGVFFIIIWKGVYDLVETGAQNLFRSSHPDNFNMLSELFDFVLSFSLYMILMLTQQRLQKDLRRVFGRLTTYVLDLIEFMIYIILVAYWRVAWDMYDILAYRDEIKQYRTLVWFSSHIGVFIVFTLLGLSANIMGFGFSSETENEEEGKIYL